MIVRVRERWAANGIMDNQPANQQTWWGKMFNDAARTVLDSKHSVTEFNKYADQLMLKMSNVDELMVLMSANLVLCYGLQEQEEESKQRSEPLLQNAIVEEESKAAAVEEVPEVQDFDVVEREQVAEPGAAGDEERFEVKFAQFVKEDFAEVTQLYTSGAKRINVSATGCVLMVLLKTLRDIIEQINTIINKDALVQFKIVRKFILSQLHFLNAEVMLYAAFGTPEDDLFYLPEDSFEWQLINEHLEVIEVENPGKYLKQLRFALNQIMVSGSTIFQSGMQENSFNQGVSFMVHGALYQLSPS